MPSIPSVIVTVVDNGASAAISVPQSNVQLKLGCAIGGTVNHWSCGIPFVLNNRVLASSGVPASWSSGVPFTSGGHVCIS